MRRLVGVTLCRAFSDTFGGGASIVFIISIIFFAIAFPTRSVAQPKSQYPEMSIASIGVLGLPDEPNSEEPPWGTGAPSRNLSMSPLRLLVDGIAKASVRGVVQSRTEKVQGTNNIFSGGNIEGLSIRDVFDEQMREGVLPSAFDTACVNSENFDLAAWAVETSSGIGSSRSKIVDAGMQVETDAVKTLAKFYLSNGFGAEVHKLRKLLPDGTESDVFGALADILDFGETSSTVFRNQVNCSNGASLWSALSGPISIADIGAGNPAILREFSSIPVAVRLQVGHVLAERLRSVGLETDAQVVLNSIARQGGSESPDYRLAASRIGLGGVAAQEARTDLETLANSNDPTAPKALQVLLEHAFANDEMPRMQWLENAESIIRAIRGSRSEMRLRYLWIDGLIKVRDFAPAKRGLYSFMRSYPDSEEIRLLYAKLLTEVIEHGSDSTMVQAVLLGDDGLLNSVEIGAKAGDLKKRLTGLGLQSDSESLVLAQSSIVLRTNRAEASQDGRLEVDAYSADPSPSEILRLSEVLRSNLSETR